MNRMISIGTVVMLAFFAGCQQKPPSLDISVKIGSTFPTIVSTDIDGQPISTADFKGKVVLLDFFGDW